MLWALSTQDRSARELCGKEVWRAGKATAITSRFRETRKAGSPVTSRITAREGVRGTGRP